MSQRYFSIAIDLPQTTLFCYCSDHSPLQPVGCRVSVPFGKKQKIGIVIKELQQPDFDTSKIKTVTEWLDQSPLIDASLLQLIEWAADYYLYPLPAALFHLLPVWFRKGGNKQELFEQIIQPLKNQPGEAGLQRAPKQKALLETIKQHGSIALSQLRQSPDYSSATLKQLVAKKRINISKSFYLPQIKNDKPSAFLSLNPQQKQAWQSVQQHLHHFQVFLLEGVTGSGKTEVYSHIIRDVLQQQKQVLLLVPEIGLTPQLLERLSRRFNYPVFSLHSELNDTERAKIWLGCRTLDVQILVGTRSALFSPFKNLGLIIIDEEHDHSLKQQDGFRYHARDLAIVLAQRKQIPVILGSATPSYESYYNLAKPHYHHLILSQRAGKAKAPSIHLLDMNKGSTEEGISDRLLPIIEKHLAEKHQVMFFINRRGFSPVLMCSECHWMKDCHRCDSHMTWHQQQNRMKCHHCGVQSSVPTRCPNCNTESLIAIGQGTERIENYLQQRFSDKTLIRIDRDSTQKKAALEQHLEQINQGKVDIIIGTQMLAKGHHFPNVTLVVVVNADGGLYSGDFRAFEQTAQQIIQVAGRAGRAEHPGEVVVQTRFIENEMLAMLVRQGYAACAQKNMQERIASGFPPGSRCILLRAQSHQQESGWQFLQQVADKLFSLNLQGVQVLGPVPAPMERIAGRYRFQLLLLGKNYPLLRKTGKHLQQWLYQGDFGRKVHWSLDVDPVNLA